MVMPEQLVIRDDYYRAERHWYHSNEPIDEQSVLTDFNPTHFDRIPFSLTRLRRLAIRSDLDRFDLTILNELKRLRHLELSLVNLKEDQTLVLPALKVLNLLGVTQRRLRVESPNLEVLACWFGLGMISLSNPKTIRLLHLAYGSSGDWRVLRIFENVTVFITNHPNSLSKAIMEQLPRLKQLRLMKDQEPNLFNFKLTAGQIDQLFEQRRSLRSGPDPQIFFNDTLLEDERTFRDRRFIVKHFNCFQVSKQFEFSGRRSN